MTAVAARDTAPSTALAVTLFGIAAAATVALPLLPQVVDRLPALGLTPVLDERIRYQLLALALTGIVVGIAAVLAPASRRYLQRGDMGAPVAPARYLGLNPKPHETWRHVGRNFAIVLPTVTAVAVGFQVLKGNAMTGADALWALPWAIGLAAANAVVEEGICRFGVLAALEDRFGANVAIAASAALFGGVHWFGVPGGLGGVALAGFLGALLAKSIIETRGLGWALVLHFLVDVPILVALLGVGR